MYKFLKASSCQVIDAIDIIEQTLPLGLLRNGWLDFSRPVYELNLKNSNITHIRSGAFNSPLFADTYLLSLIDLKLKRVGGGALIGLKSLRYLIIDTQLNEINRAFLQPVQLTLLHLRINSGLTILSGQTIFGVSTLTRLEFADLSHNVFAGPLTRQMFLATPNLHYLHIMSSQITAIGVDAFQDLKHLQVVDLADNLLATISITALKPLLFGRKPTLVNLAYNKWHCDCDLQEFTKFYRIYRNQFLGTLYCHSPFRHNGELLSEILFANDDCATETTTNYEGIIGELVNISATSTMSDLSKVPSTTKPATSLARTTSEVPTIEVTALTPPDRGNSRSSSEDLGIIQLRCLNSSYEQKSSSKIKRAVEIIIQSTESADSQENANNLNNSSEESSESEQSDEIASSNPFTPRPVEFSTSEPTYSPSKDEVTTTRSRHKNSRKSIVAFYEFEVPSYTFNLTLLPNNSVKVVIKDYNSQPVINVIWFRRKNDTAIRVDGEAAKNIDYNCEMYQEPYLIANNLTKNYTYTFCMLPLTANSYTISPFNCQPMHVPTNRLGGEETEIWISADEKQFTIGMLCIIFTLSTFFGGIIAYFGIKTYPELLEGSKNVLVVKSSEPETDYLKSMDSIKKQPLSRRSTRKLIPSSLETPPLSLPPPPPPPFCVSTHDLERLSSVKSSSTFFESSFGPSPFAVVDDQYELPKQYSHTIDEERCIANAYAKSPCSPPPLPKRNLSITSSIGTNHSIKAD
ncbi:uncharacterized protein LOC118743893 [Rhagoletis pomonella]|uniref:uncharacterized protein LOC118743893 n=1 Tax=Rhagoletis pomonella TaxID=28610 RepID=UPI00177B8EC0|nr:uncharacterized protein LOC118743893 [Rhagoletis pomonella]